MFTHPGKKPNFIGNELAQIFEWDEKKELDWDALKNPVHAEFYECCQRLNETYIENSVLWQNDYDKSSFQWILKGEGGNAVLTFTRTSDNQKLLAVMNFSGEDVVFNKTLAGDETLLFDTHGKETVESFEDGIVCLSPFEGLLFELR